MLELDHVFCVVSPEGDWAERLQVAGWRLDSGTVHAGQGTRNRRLVLTGQYLELVWVHDPDEAARNPLRLDRRADWRTTGASPFGFGLRGRVPDTLRHDFWRYDGLPIPVWVHRDNEEAVERPMVFVLDLEAAPPGTATGRTGSGRPESTANPRSLRSVDHSGGLPAPLPEYVGAPVRFTAGPHHLDLVVDAGGPVVVSDLLAITARPGSGPPASRRHRAVSP